MSNYKENSGSRWHKWDLHVHTPTSGLNNLFGGESDTVWDKYVQTLFKTAIDNEVAVIGITDYFLIDGYKRMRKDYLSNDTKLLSLFSDQSTVNKINLLM